MWYASIFGSRNHYWQGLFGIFSRYLEFGSSSIRDGPRYRSFQSRKYCRFAQTYPWWWIWIPCRVRLEWSKGFDSKNDSSWAFWTHFDPLNVKSSVGGWRFKSNWWLECSWWRWRLGARYARGVIIFQTGSPWRVDSGPQQQTKWKWEHQFCECRKSLLSRRASTHARPTCNATDKLTRQGNL